MSESFDAIKRVLLEGHKSKASALSSVLVPHYGYIHHISILNKVLFNIAFFSRVQDASNKILLEYWLFILGGGILSLRVGLGLLVGRYKVGVGLLGL
mmetsp:Transcript_42306/g.40529  ORF Transcript_42306/g.40529 Transcript_42306/m.40529 type:complete len:97 (+) Transcript_42306:894-1184(+)